VQPSSLSCKYHILNDSLSQIIK